MNNIIKLSQRRFERDRKAFLSAIDAFKEYNPLGFEIVTITFKRAKRKNDFESIREIERKLIESNFCTDKAIFKVEYGF